MAFEQYGVKDPSRAAGRSAAGASRTYAAAGRGQTTVTTHPGKSAGEEFLDVATGLGKLATVGKGVYKEYKADKHDKEVDIHMEGMSKDPEGYVYDYEKYDDYGAFAEAQAELASVSQKQTEAVRSRQMQQHELTSQLYAKNQPLAAAAEAMIMDGRHKEGVLQAQAVFNDIPNGTEWKIDWDKKKSWKVYANGKKSEPQTFDDAEDLAQDVMNELRQVSDPKFFAGWMGQAFTAHQQQNLHGIVNQEFYVNEKGEGGSIMRVQKSLGAKVEPMHADAHGQILSEEQWKEQGFVPVKVYKERAGIKKTEAETRKLEAETKAVGAKGAAEKMGTIEKNQRGFMRAYEGLSKDKAMDMAVQLTMMPTLFKELEDWAEKEMIDKSDPEEFARYLQKKEEIYGTPEAVLGAFKPRRSTGQLHEKAIMGQGQGIQEGKATKDVAADETAKKAELADLIKEFGKEAAIRKMREKYPYFGQELGI